VSLNALRRNFKFKQNEIKQINIFFKAKCSTKNKVVKAKTNPLWQELVTTSDLTEFHNTKYHRNRVR